MKFDEAIEKILENKMSVQEIADKYTKNPAGIGADSIEDGKDYSIKVDFDSTKDVIGKLIVKKDVEKVDNSIPMSKIKVGETIVIMTGRGDSVPQLFGLVDKTRKVYSHVFENPVTGKKTQFKSTDPWKIYRINDLIKK